MPMKLLFTTDILSLLSVKGIYDIISHFCGMRISEWVSEWVSDSDSGRHKRSRTNRNTATTVPCCTGCCNDDWFSCASHILLLTDTTGEALQLPLSHICFTHCLHYQIPVWVFWREFCSCCLSLWLCNQWAWCLSYCSSMFSCTWGVRLNSEVN